MLYFRARRVSTNHFFKETKDACREERSTGMVFFKPSCAWCSGGVVPGSMHKHLKNWGENSEIGSLASLLCVGNGNGMLCRGIPVRVVPLSL